MFICRGVVWAAAPRSQGEASSYRQTGAQLLWDSCSSLGAGALLPLVLPGDGKGRGRARGRPSREASLEPLEGKKKGRGLLSTLAWWGCSWVHFYRLIEVGGRFLCLRSDEKPLTGHPNTRLDLFHPSLLLRKTLPSFPQKETAPVSPARLYTLVPCYPSAFAGRPISVKSPLETHAEKNQLHLCVRASDPVSPAFNPPPSEPGALGG